MTLFGTWIIDPEGGRMFIAFNIPINSTPKLRGRKTVINGFSINIRPLWGRKTKLLRDQLNKNTGPSSLDEDPEYLKLKEYCFLLNRK